MASLLTKAHQLETQLASAVRELHDTRRLLQLRTEKHEPAAVANQDVDQDADQDVDQDVAHQSATNKESNHQEAATQEQQEGQGQPQGLQEHQAALQQRVCELEEALQHAQRACAQYKVDHEVNTLVRVVGHSARGIQINTQTHMHYHLFCITFHAQHNDMLRTQLHSAAATINHLKAMVQQTPPAAPAAPQQSDHEQHQQQQQEKRTTTQAKYTAKGSQSCRVRSLLYFKRKVVWWCGIVLTLMLHMHALMTHAVYMVANPTPPPMRHPLTAPMQ